MHEVFIHVIAFIACVLNGCLYIQYDLPLPCYTCPSNPTPHHSCPFSAIPYHSIYLWTHVLAVHPHSRVGSPLSAHGSIHSFLGHSRFGFGILWSGLTRPLSLSIAHWHRWEKCWMDCPATSSANCILATSRVFLARLGRILVCITFMWLKRTKLLASLSTLCSHFGRSGWTDRCIKHSLLVDASSALFHSALLKTRRRIRSVRDGIKVGPVMFEEVVLCFVVHREEAVERWNQWKSISDST